MRLFFAVACSAAVLAIGAALPIWTFREDGPPDSGWVIWEPLKQRPLWRLLNQATSELVAPTWSTGRLDDAFECYRDDLWQLLALGCLAYATGFGLLRFRTRQARSIAAAIAQCDDSPMADLPSHDHAPARPADGRLSDGPR